MYNTTPVRNVTILACCSLIVIGAFDDLNALATLIAANVTPGHLHVILIEYPTGWRLQIISDSNRYPDDAHDLVEQRIREGLPVQIANGKQAMATRVYTVPPTVQVAMEDAIVHTDEHPFCDDETCPCHTDVRLVYKHVVRPFMAGEITGREAVAFTYDRSISPPQPQDDADRDALPWRNCAECQTLY